MCQNQSLGIITIIRTNSLKVLKYKLLRQDFVHISWKVYVEISVSSSPSDGNCVADCMYGKPPRTAVYVQTNCGIHVCFSLVPLFHTHSKHILKLRTNKHLQS